MIILHIWEISQHRREIRIGWKCLSLCRCHPSQLCLIKADIRWWTEISLTSPASLHSIVPVVTGQWAPSYLSDSGISQPVISWTGRHLASRKVNVLFSSLVNLDIWFQLTICKQCRKPKRIAIQGLVLFLPSVSIWLKRCWKIDQDQN